MHKGSLKNGHFKYSSSKYNFRANVIQRVLSRCASVNEYVVLTGNSNFLMCRVPSNLRAFAFEVWKNKKQSQWCSDYNIAVFWKIACNGHIGTPAPATSGKLADFRQRLLFGARCVGFIARIRLKMRRESDELNRKRQRGRTLLLRS